VTININGTTGIIKQFGPLTGLAKSAVDKGYHKIGTIFFRNLRKTGDLTWTGQYSGITYNTSAPNVATGTGWGNVTITLSVDGKTFFDSDNGITYTRQ
jgi:hypothetical protein